MDLILRCSEQVVEIDYPRMRITPESDKRFFGLFSFFY